MDVLSKNNLLRNVRKDNCDLAILSTGGNTTTNLVEDLPGYGTVWFHPGGIANILSLSKLAEIYQVCYDITNVNNFLFIYLAEKCAVSNSVIAAYSTPI